MSLFSPARRIETVLIANRGEIAVRVARTCRALNIKTVAVYSEADAEAYHVAACDEAWPIGPAPARESYLSIGKILDVARRSGADAIHPGYGFLSENAEFAEACAEAGVVFIGPPIDAIRAMGSKSAAKAIMEKAGVPLVPGYHGGDQSAERLAAAAEEIGYPVLIKASAGGGGKGMRRVDRPADFAGALASAQREAKSAFGDARVLIEKYLLSPRHVEVQVFADGHGNVVHLFERDCSVQRRHQKVVEEAPAPGLDAARRQAFGEAAVAAARAIGYCGAGTVEFIMDAGAGDAGDFYFMEMNTRLQVEHPVTEMITGQDLVAWQIAVAAGEPLPTGQDQLRHEGHAFEVRLYAEDAERDFMPAVGRIEAFHRPAESAHVRVDSGVRAGDEISVHYDPMIAKLIVWDRDRPAALARLRQALAETAIAGTTTNLAFLERIARHPAFAKGGVDTGFIETYRDDLLSPPPPASHRLVAVAALQVLLAGRRRAAMRAERGPDPWSPWNDTSGWRLNGDNHHKLVFLDAAREIGVTAHYRPKGFHLEIAEEGGAAGTFDADAEARGNAWLRVSLDGLRFDAQVVEEQGSEGMRLTVRVNGESARLRLKDLRAGGGAGESAGGSFTAPMPGTILAVHVAPGDRVAEGDALIVLEAMKMEHTIRAFAAGVVEEIHFQAGEQVADGAELLRVAADGTKTGEAKRKE